MGTLYTKRISGRSQLFYTPDANNNETQLTLCSDSTFPLFGTMTQNYNAVGPDYFGGYTFLPGGLNGALLFQYGYVDNPINAGGKAVKFPIEFSDATSIVISLTPVVTFITTFPPCVLDGSIGTKQYKLVVESGATEIVRVHWTAIGF